MCETEGVAECGNETIQGSNLTVSGVQRDKLIQYYHRRKDALDFCDATCDHAIDDEKQEIMDLINRGQRSEGDPEIQQALGKLAGPIASTSRNCMLIAVCCLLEDLLRRVGNLALSDYDSAFKKDKRKHNENFLRTHRRILETKVGIDFQQVEGRATLLDHAILIRNSLVHAWGKVDTSTNPGRLREALDAVKWAVESLDGYVSLDDQACPEVMKAAMQLAEHVFEQLIPSV